MGDFIVNFQESFLSKVEELLEWSENTWSTFFDKIAEIRQSILDIPQQIYEKIQELFERFFVPDEEATNEKLAALREKFAFIDSITGYGEHVINFLQGASGAKAPVITIDLSDYTGNYNWGTTVITIDFAWYAQFKPMVDNILAGIIWITWLWHMYKRIPELINGQGMTTASVADVTIRRE